MTDTTQELVITSSNYGMAPEQAWLLLDGIRTTCRDRKKILAGQGAHRWPVQDLLVTIVPTAEVFAGDQGEILNLVTALARYGRHAGLKLILMSTYMGTAPGSGEMINRLEAFGGSSLLRALMVSPQASHEFRFASQQEILAIVLPATTS